MRKRVVSFLMAALMVLTLLPTTVFASNTRSVQYTEVNPIYADVVSREELLRQAPVYHSDSDGEVEYLSATSEIAEQIRRELVARNTQFTVHIKADEQLQEQDISELFSAALEETDSPVEGDYLRFQYAGYTANMTGQTDGTYYYLDLTYRVTYYTTAQQEQEVTERIREVLEEQGVDPYNGDALNTWRIYNYIVGHVTYDEENLNDQSYTLKYTAYAALINGTSVCQGYAVLLYRMLREAGVSCRVVTGTGNGEPHAWNVIGVNGTYYAADATWETGTWRSWSYFLRTNENMEGHTLDAEYTAEPFTSRYPMAASDYGTDHEHDAEYGYAYYDEAGHWYACQVCDLPVKETAESHIDNGYGACTGCFYVFPSHVCVARDGYSYDEEEHYQFCRNCRHLMKETRAPHEYDGLYCTVCGAVNPDHTCVAGEGYGYYRDDVRKGHFNTCKYCDKIVEETQAPHEYDDPYCTVCGAVNPDHTCKAKKWCWWGDTEHWKVCKYCYGEIEGTRGGHNFADGCCTVCGAADPDHTCVAEGEYYNNGEIHFQRCKYCHEAVEETRAPHEYDGLYCTVCGAVNPDHTCIEEEEYTSYVDDGGHHKVCKICHKEIEGTWSPHEYEDWICTVCGAADPDHTCEAGDKYSYYGGDDVTKGHFKTCKYCRRILRKTLEPHVYDGLYCTVCGAVNPDHTCVAGEWYQRDETEHRKVCEICHKEIEGTRGDHNFVDGRCTVCGAVDPDHTCVAEERYESYEDNGEFGHYKQCKICYREIEGTRAPHEYEDWICTVCGAADPDHTCEPEEWYASYEDNGEFGHYKQCKICYREIEGTRAPHEYEDWICTVCGAADPDHTCEPEEWYASYEDNGEFGHYKRCKICYREIEGTRAPHEYEDWICTVCGAADPNHTCEAQERYQWDDTEHWKICKYCYGEIEGTRGAHNFEDGDCTVCGRVDLAHTCEAQEWYQWDDTEHWKICKYCYGEIEGTRAPHEYEDWICTVCGAADPDHTCVAGSWYDWDLVTGEHYRSCQICNEIIEETRQAHSYNELGICEVCGFVGPGHTQHVADQRYAKTDAGHSLKCKYCGDLMGEVKKHTYEEGFCTECGMAAPDHTHVAWEGYYYKNVLGHRRMCWLCDEYMGDDWQAHTFNSEDICTVCGYGRDGHTCVAQDYWFGFDGGHVRYCKYCGEMMEMERTEHDYVHGICTICGQVAPVHEHCYTYSPVDCGHLRMCRFCSEDAQYEKHSFDANNICTVCGAMKYQRQEEITAVRLSVDEDGRLHLTLTMSNGETLATIVTSIESTSSSDLLMENGVCAGTWNTGVIRTNLCVLEMMWAMYDDGRFCVRTMQGVTSNTIGGANHIRVQTEAYNIYGMVDTETTFENGSWIVTGRLADGTKARLTMDENLENQKLTILTTRRGDVNGDGNIDVLDLLLLRRHISGGYNDPEFLVEAADLNGDGVVDMTDLVLMRQYLAGGYGVTLDA